MSRRPTSRAIPPLYVLRAGECCPECGAGTNVYTLAASGLHDVPQDATLEGFLVLTHIESLPKRLLALLKERCTGYGLDREAWSESPYLMNHCQCGAKLTDHYVHAEPGSAFFPTSPEECWNISLFTLPVSKEMPLRCSWTAGLGDLLDLDKALPW